MSDTDSLFWDKCMSKTAMHILQAFVILHKCLAPSNFNNIHFNLGQPSFKTTAYRHVIISILVRSCSNMDVLNE
uniref:Uncharacterized protein n=1 Tax=Labrus bergylta TaxID=56723 RepID=A0A3Q3F361_9LABR